MSTVMGSTSNIPSAGAPPVVGMTAAAAEHVLKLMLREKKEGSALRVSVIGGGCSGLSYKMNFENEPAATDRVTEQHGLRIFVDPKSALFLQGITIDFVDGLNGSGFTYENPNAKRSCGCGTSFSA